MMLEHVLPSGKQSPKTMGQIAIFFLEMGTLWWTNKKLLKMAIEI